METKKTTPRKRTPKAAATLTPEMQLAIGRGTAKNAEQAHKMLLELNLRSTSFTQKDITTWRNAWQLAINVDEPRRLALYDIYTDVLVDMHLSGCIAQRKGFALRQGFYLADQEGKKNDQASALIQAEWFADFADLVLDSRYWGHSLIEMGNIVTGPTGTPTFDYVRLVPRKHVRQEYGVVVRDQYDSHTQGISYREGPLAEWCIEVGKSHDLGLLLNCCPSALSKKNMMAFWDGFGEIFGIPMRIARTNSRDQKEMDKLQSILEQMGAAFSGVFPDGTEIEIKESTRGDAFNVFDRRIDRANSEMSKGILNQTMTIDSGSSLSQSEVHLEVFENVVESDRRLLSNVVNTRLLPFMQRVGFPVAGLHFVWDNTPNYSPEQLLNVEQMLLTGGYQIDPSYFEQKYNIPLITLPNAEDDPANTSAKPARISPLTGKPLSPAEKVALELVKDLTPDFFV